MSTRAYFSDTIEEFLRRNDDDIIGQLTRASEFAIESTQTDAWVAQIAILRSALARFSDCGKIYFEYSIPRMGRRIDVVVLIRHIVFVLEFKVGEARFSASATDQVWDYALDLKNFHQATHNKPVVPVLIATHASTRPIEIRTTTHDDGLYVPIHSAAETLGETLDAVLRSVKGSLIDATEWERGKYSPTPTIIEAAMALYGGHGVVEISRSDAGAINLEHTSRTIESIVEQSRATSSKAVCFVTGVPGAGKTLVGLNVATQHIDSKSQSYSVFLSGNGPLVAILREALARDKVRREKHAGRRFKLSEARSEVKAFIQNVHHFRDDCLADAGSPPEHVALFDEAQRAWNLEKTASFMRQKKKRPDFTKSEPEFLLSCMDRHQDWAVVVCLVGGGQEINTGEAGIGEWVRSILRSFPEWQIHLSSRLTDSEYGAGEVLTLLEHRPKVHYRDDLHLGVSMRSFRAEHVSAFVKQLLDCEESGARETLEGLADRYPIVLTRSVDAAKEWLREQARGSERYGMVVSSQAQRLKPYAIDVRTPMDPVHWFLDPKEDVRSSYYLEDVATEFHVQGLELDWCCVVWDADFRRVDTGWKHFSFVGDRWNRINKLERQMYLKNAYRVLLTRARQGMVIVVPEGDPSDPTRSPEFYSDTYSYLKRLGLVGL